MKTGPALAILLCATAFLAAFVFMPPIAQRIDQPLLAGIAYPAFAPICHQLPGRSFHINGMQLAVCVRCSGIYWGLFLGALVFTLRRKPLSGLMFLPIILITADSLLNFIRVIDTPSWLRFVFGLGFGLAGGRLLAFGTADLDEMLKAWKEKKWGIASTT